MTKVYGADTPVTAELGLLLPGIGKNPCSHRRGGRVGADASRNQLHGGAICRELC